MLSAVIFSILSYPAMQLALQLEHQRYVHPGPFVPRAALLNFPTLMVDRNQTVSRRFKPNSRSLLTIEQMDPWQLLHHQDRLSRHRSVKQARRYDLSELINRLSPTYLLSVDRWPFHMEPPGHYNQLSFLINLSITQSGRLMLLHSKTDFRPVWTYLCTPSLLFRRQPPQLNYPPYNVPLSDKERRLGAK